MKFDHDLARQILLQIENDFTKPNNRLKVIAGNNYAEYYTVRKLVEGEFLRATAGETLKPENSSLQSQK